MTNYQRVNILGCPFDSISYSETVDSIRSALINNNCFQYCVGNIDMVIKVRRNPEFAKLFWQSDFVFADGVPVVWAASLLGHPLKGRVSGTDLVWSCAQISAELSRPIAMVGGELSITRSAAENLNAKFPDAEIYPVDTPFPLDSKNNEKIIRYIKSVGAKIVLVALGAPRQEVWIRNHLRSCNANIGIGIGSAFDIISGNKPRAPKWMCDNGLEWFHRLMQEPKRLGRRYLIEDSPFLFFLVLEIIRCRIFKMRGCV